MITCQQQRTFERRGLAQTGARRRRRAAAAVEFALVAPILATIIVGMFETSRGFMVKMALNDAARKGCETGTLSLASNASITSDVNDVLTDNGISTSAATITILVNGLAKDASTAKQNDKVSVQVSVSTSKVSWTTTYLFLTSATIQSETVVMLRRG
jgi:Flp pilus assembly protein TadG